MKYLLGDEVCTHCNGLGVFRDTHLKFRVRVKFPNDTWEFIDQTFSSLEDATWNAVEIKVENNKLECEVIAPSGKIISV